MLLRKRFIAIAVAAAMLTVGVVGIAVAQDDPAPSNVRSGVVTVVEVKAPDADTEDAQTDLDDDFCFGGEWEPTAEELAEINAETEALAEHLRGLGFEVTVETDEFGFTYVDFESEDEALFAAMDDFYRQLFADEIAGWSDEEKAEWNAEIDEWVAELAAEGITVETEEIAPGVYDIVWTEELELALIELEPIDECFVDDEALEEV